MAITHNYLFSNVASGTVTGHGVIKLPYLTVAPTRLENGMMWTESDGLHIYVNDTEKLIAGV